MAATATFTINKVKVAPSVMSLKLSGLVIGNRTSGINVRTTETGAIVQKRGIGCRSVRATATNTAAADSWRQPRVMRPRLGDDAAAESQPLSA